MPRRWVWKRASCRGCRVAGRAGRQMEGIMQEEEGKSPNTYTIHTSTKCLRTHCYMSFFLFPALPNHGRDGANGATQAAAAVAATATLSLILPQVSPGFPMQIRRSQSKPQTVAPAARKGRLGREASRGAKHKDLCFNLPIQLLAIQI